MVKDILTPGAFAPKPTELRAFDDINTLRRQVHENVLQGLSSRFPIENERYRLELSDIQFAPKDFSIKEQKDAILRGRTLNNPVKGTWSLIDKSTGGVVDNTRRNVLGVPYLNQQGTYIYRGNQYTISNQARLRPGVYARRKESGELESHFNVKPRTGYSFRLMLEPETGVFRMVVGQAKLKLLPILRRMGLKEEQIRRSWGNELFTANAGKEDPTAYTKALSRLASRRSKTSVGEAVEEKLLDVLARSELDPEVTQKTLGEPYANITPEVLLRATGKLINVSRKEEDVDDRDSIEFQSIHDASDLFRERIEQDAGMQARRALWRATYRGNLKGMRAGELDRQLESAIYGSGLGIPLEEINPTEISDKNLRLIRLGEGGISSIETVPEDSRNVQASQFSVVDPIISPESMKIGIDLRTAINTFKGSDGQMYTNMINVRSGDEEQISARDLANSVVAFPGEMKKKDKQIRAMVRGRLSYAPKTEVDYELPHVSEMFTAGSNLVPMISAIKGQRLMMGARMSSQALPLENPESPLVQSSDRDGKSFEGKYGTFAGAIRADQPGRVVEITPDKITVRQMDGKERGYELYNNFPYNRKTYQHNTSNVRVGDVVTEGDLLARSNYTDSEGTLALGKNLRVGYLAWKGNFEDAIVISESAAKKLSSEHMYGNEIEYDEQTKGGKSRYLTYYPAIYPREQLDTIDDEGVIMPGTKVNKGDPLMLAVKMRKPRPGEKLFRQRSQDQTITWDHEEEGVVTDVTKDRLGARVFIKSLAPMEVGDKLSGRYGDKGVIRDIIPDSEMPRDADDNPIEIAINPLGVVTRVNPAQLFEAALGKIAEKRGKPYVLDSFADESLVDFVESELKKNNVSDTEDLIDPATGAKVKNVFTGSRFFMKLHHTAESKESARDTGAYTLDLAPAKGGKEGAKRIGNQEIMALVSHGASEVLRDVKNIRGQRNDDFWRAFRLGYHPPTPRVPHAYEKFMAFLQGGGINVHKKGNTTNIMALTDKDVEELSGGEVQNPEVVDARDLKPIKGGLFDPDVFGGHGGRSWGHINLAEPMPSPIMENVTRSLLNLTKNQFREVLSGERQLHGLVGGQAMQAALRNINIGNAIEEQRMIIDSGRKSKRDGAIKKLGFLKMMQKTGIRPEELIMTKVPVLPTAFRPVSTFRQGQREMPITASANVVYKDLIQINDKYRTQVKELGRKHSGDEALALYDAFRAVTGLGDPITTEAKRRGVRGVLKSIFGSKPKYGLFQRQVISSPVDVVARGVVTPNPSLHMDQVGIPEEQAWKLYRPFAMRRMVQQGVPPTTAATMIADEDPRAKRALMEEMARRPVLVNRNPTLHKYGIMAAFPILVKGKTLQVSPIVTGGFGMDFDGDTAQYHVPVSEEARREAIERMLPSRNLLSQADFGVHYVPKNEYAMGLYQASALKNRKAERTFRSKEDVIAAFMRGEIDLDSKVNIIGEAS